MSHYTEILSEQEMSAAVARAEQGKKDYARLVEAQNGLDAWRRNDLDAELRREQSAAEKRDRASASVTCDMDRAAVRRCEALLRESAKLLTEGGELLQRNAANHDAVIKAMR